MGTTPPLDNGLISEEEWCQMIPLSNNYSSPVASGFKNSPASPPVVAFDLSPRPSAIRNGAAESSILSSSALSGWKQAGNDVTESPRNTTRKVTFLQDTFNNWNESSNDDSHNDNFEHAAGAVDADVDVDGEPLHDKMARLRVYNEKAAGAACSSSLSSPLASAPKKTNHTHAHALNHGHTHNALDTIEEEGSDKEDGSWMMGLLEWSLDQEDFDRSSNGNGYGLNSFPGPLTPSNSERGSEPAWSERGSEWGSEWSSERGSDWGGSEWGEHSELDESDWEPLPLSALNLRDSASLRGESSSSLLAPTTSILNNGNNPNIIPDLAPTLSNVSSSSANTLTNFHSTADYDTESVATSVDLNETATTANTTIDMFVAAQRKKLNDRPQQIFSSNGSVTSTNTASSRRSNIVDHTYVDYSICEDHEGAPLIGNPIRFVRDAEQGQVIKVEIQDPIERSTKSKRNCDAARNTFPKTLKYILSQPTLTSIVSWLPHGRSFLVHNAKKMESEVLPRFFKQTKIKSFLRQLNKWGFKRITAKKGVDEGSYYHEYFLRGNNKSTLIANMKYVKVKGEGNKQWQSNPDEEPDFYALAEVRPLSSDDTLNATNTNGGIMRNIMTPSSSSKFTPQYHHTHSNNHNQQQQQQQRPVMQYPNARPMMVQNMMPMSMSPVSAMNMMYPAMPFCYPGQYPMNMNMNMPMNMNPGFVLPMRGSGMIRPNNGNVPANSSSSSSSPKSPP